MVWFIVFMEREGGGGVEGDVVWLFLPGRAARMQWSDG